MSRLTKQAEAERDEAIGKLRDWLKPGDTVYTVLRHVSRSGMQREISVVLLTADGPLHPSWAVAKAIGARLNRKGPNDAIVVSGCGMDMGFHIVYNLGRALWPDGYPCSGKGCPSNDYSNGDRDYRKGHRVHQDGGYALRQVWL
jgi:hypothetical protein